MLVTSKEKMNDTTRIAGYKTVSDWKNLRNRIRGDISNSNFWNEAFDLFEKRLETRYFKPIKDIKGNDQYNGEGFAITAILCSLIEFLESTHTGEIYRYCRDNQLQKFEYNRSKDKFVSFFENRSPFNTIFTSANGLAPQFYENVRCGLLHEASTKGNWKIRVDNSMKFYELRNEDHVIDREIFEEKIREYLSNYKNMLVANDNLKSAFIRKMNNIAGLQINF